MVLTGRGGVISVGTVDDGKFHQLLLLQLVFSFLLGRKRNHIMLNILEEKQLLYTLLRPMYQNNSVMQLRGYWMVKISSICEGEGVPHTTQYFFRTLEEDQKTQ